MPSFDSTRYPILVVDDEQDNLDAFRFAYRRSFTLDFALGADQALARLEACQPAVVVSDQRMPGMSGIELLQVIQQKRPDTVGILLTAYTELPLLLEAIHSGAVHRYVQKPWDSKELAMILRQALERYAVLEDNRRLREQLARYAGYLERQQRDPLEFGALLGPSPAITKLQRHIAEVAPSSTTILLRGEAGCAKRVVARAIHTQSDREHWPFVEFAAAGYAPEAHVRELCGWHAGAVPGALEERAGRLELAHRGTLLIEEIGALSLPAQTALLRALEQGTVERIGAGEPLRIDVRITATTTRDLRSLVAMGAFLSALQSRLEVFPIEVPALRTRRDDIEKLADHILLRLSQKNARVPRAITPQALDLLRTYEWPGNIRELENTLERAAILSRGGTIDVPHLQFAQEVSKADPTAASLSVSAGAGPETNPTIALPEQLDELERRELLRALEQCRGNKAEVARMLGIQRTTLYYRLKRLGIEG